jgi:uncharacterized protein (DUF1499 family)
MARRLRLSEEPMSRLAAWSRRLALFALAVAALSILIVRSNLLEIVPALATFAAALVFAALAILLAFPAFVAIWRQGKTGLGAALSGLLLGLLLLAYPGYLAYRASKLPPISDISTDAGDPPRFDALARARPSDRIAYPGAAAAQVQRAAYPDVAPLQVSAPVKLTYDVALALVTKRKWHVAEARPPAGNRRDAVIEATARTPIMGFRDDVVIRIRPASGGTRVDARSSSRYGFHDFGANASRLISLLSDIDDATPAEVVEQAAKKGPQKPGTKPPPKGAQPSARR